MIFDAASLPWSDEDEPTRLAWAEEAAYFGLKDAERYWAELEEGRLSDHVMDRMNGRYERALKILAGNDPMGTLKWVIEIGLFKPDRSQYTNGKSRAGGGFGDL